MWGISKYDRRIYHFLSCTFGEGVSIAQVVDLDIFDVVAILLVDFTVDVGHGCFGLWTRLENRLSMLVMTTRTRLKLYRSDGWDFDMLNASLGLERSVDPRSSGSSSGSSTALACIGCARGAVDGTTASTGLGLSACGRTRTPVGLCRSLIEA